MRKKRGGEGAGDAGRAKKKKKKKKVSERECVRVRKIESAEPII